MANAIASLDDRIREMEADMRAVKAQAKFEAIKETQHMLNAVQGAFNKRSDLTVRISLLERQVTSEPLIAISKLPRGDEIPPT